MKNKKALDLSEINGYVDVICPFCKILLTFNIKASDKSLYTCPYCGTTISFCKEELTKS